MLANEEQNEYKELFIGEFDKTRKMRWDTGVMGTKIMNTGDGFMMNVIRTWNKYAVKDGDG